LLPGAVPAVHVLPFITAFQPSRTTASASCQGRFGNLLAHRMSEADKRITCRRLMEALLQ